MNENSTRYTRQISKHTSGLCNLVEKLFSRDVLPPFPQTWRDLAGERDEINDRGGELLISIYTPYIHTYICILEHQFSSLSGDISFYSLQNVI